MLSDNAALMTSPGANPPLFTKARLPPMTPAVRNSAAGVAPMASDCAPLFTAMRLVRNSLPAVSTVAAVMLFCWRLLMIVVAEFNRMFPPLPVELMRTLPAGAFEIVEPNAAMSV